MKPYFAKYLPVEGGKKLFFTNANNAEGIISSEGLQDVLIKEKKLFLCSRDIQVGDKFIIDGEEHTCDTLIDGRVGYKENGESILLGDADIPYRKIGEISPAAIWVKEGDEFDESEWRSVMEDADGSIYVDKQKHLPLNESYFVQVKGPCGHFH